jgi:hypothetical protein
MSDSKNRNVLTILFGFGGSGGKTIAALAELLTTDPNAAELARDRIHVVLCDTDENDLRKNKERIRRAFADRCPGLEMQVETFGLSTNVDAFCDLVENRIGVDAVHTPEGRRRIRDAWWFNEHDDPFSATGLPLPPSAGAGQCALVSHFLSWDKLDRFPETLERIDKHARNVRHMEDYAIDLIMVGSLAGGTGRGCWQLLALKAREHFGQRGQSCRPYGFFLDQSVFEDVQRGRPEQRIKLRMNSLTGLSELAMWLRSDRRMPDEDASKGQPKERRYSVPNLRAPDAPESDVLDTERYMPERERARVGRSPIHKAYVFTNQSSSMALEGSDRVYEVCSNAIYGRLMIGQMRSDDANQPARAAATAVSVLQVPVTDLRMVIQAEARAIRVENMLVGQGDAGPLVEVGAGSGRHRHSVTVKDERGRLGVEAMLTRVRNFLAVHERRPSDSQQRDGSPHALHLETRQSPAREKNLASRFEQAFASGQVEAFRAALHSFTKPSSDLQHSLREPISKVLDLKDAEKEAWSKRLEKREDPTPLLARLALEKLAVHGSDPSTTLPGLGGGKTGCIGLGLHAIQSLEACLTELSTGVQQELGRLEKKEGGRGEDAGPIASFLRSRRRLAVWPIAKFGEQSKKSIIAEASSEQLRNERPYMLKEFKKLADAMLEIVREWHANAESVVEVLDFVSKGERKTVAKRKEACFTMGDGDDQRAIADRVLRQLENDEMNPVTRVRRRLRPLYDQEAFDAIVQATLGDGGGARQAQDTFCERLMGGAKGESIDETSILHWSMRRSSDRHRFKQGVEKSLQEILSMQATPTVAMRMFSLDTVLERLVEFWCELFERNKGDEAYCRRLSDVVERICGISLLERAEAIARDGGRLGSDRLEPPPLDEIMAGTGIQLADKCDPLIRHQGDRENGDLVSILLPDTSFGSSLKPWDSWKNTLDTLWPRMPHKFAFVRTDRNFGNPYMMVAISDHPKRDFDQAGWDGWVSFDYWNDPALNEWLQMVEDPTGSSVFMEGKDDSIGLGYLDPRMVRMEHWAKRRWRPWFDPTKEKSHDRRKWEALAYAMLGNDVCESDGTPADATAQTFLRKYREFRQVFAENVVPNPHYPKDEWLLPLLEERPGDRTTEPKFTRPLFRQTADGLRRDPAVPIERFGSMRKFVEWFESDESQAVLDRIWQEQVLFAKFLEKTANSAEDVGPRLHAVMSSEHRRDIRLAMAEYVDRWIRIVEANVNREDDRVTQSAFLRDFRKLFTPDFDILRSFDAAAPSS